MKKGFFFARDIAIHEIILRGDSLVLSNAIARKTSSLSLIAAVVDVVYGIISLSHTFHRFEVSYIRRNDNSITLL